MKEIWKPLPGFGGDYMVSNLGRIVSHKNWQRRPTEKQRVLRPHLSAGYPMVNLVTRNSERRPTFVHHAVLRAFHGKAPKGFQCAHLNGNPLDPSLSNLKWVSVAENCRHKRLHGTDNAGEKHPLARLTLRDVQKIRVALLKDGYGASAHLAKKYGVSRSMISRIKVGKAWSDA